MELVGCLCLLVISALASFASGEEAESRQFSSQPYYISDSGEGGDHVRFPDDEISPEDLETAASMDSIQGLQFYAVHNGNMPLLIYPVSNAGLTSSADGGDLHTLDTMNQPQSTQPDTSNQNDFEDSLKNVAHGFIFPSSPATSHEDIFKQLLAAGSQGPAPEPYVIPTPQANKQPEPEPIIAIPQVANAFIIQPTAQPIIATYNLKQYANEPIYLAQHLTSNEGQQQKDSSQYQSQDANTIPVEAQHLQDKPSHFYMVGPHIFGEEPSSEPQKEEELRPTSPFREEPSKIPLHPPPPMKASTYGPPKPVHSSAAPGPPNRYYPSNHRPSGPPRPPAYQIKGSGSHSKGPPKSRPPPNSYRLHSGPHHHHSYPHHHHHRDSLRHHHRDVPHHHHQHKEPHYQNEDPHHHHSPPPKPQYDVHESKHNESPGRIPPNHRRPPVHSSHIHPYNYHHGPPKTSNYGGSQPHSSGSSGNSRPPINYYEPPNKPPFRYGPQKGPHHHGPPKSVSYNSPSGSNSVGNHPAITKAIFHSSHSPDQSLDQNGGPPNESHNYSPGRPEYDSEPSPTTHATLSYSSASHDNHRPSDVSAAASIAEPYVTGPPRTAYPDEEDDDSNPTVEVYGPMSENYYGADPYQRIKQTFKPPVIVYKGVRPPVRVYQKPETGPPFHHLPNPHSVHGKPTQNHPMSHSYSPSIESTWANHNTAPSPYYHQQRVRGSYSVASPSASSKSSEPPSTNVAQEIHLTTKPPFRYSPSSSSTSSSSPPDSLISSSDDSSSWTPINAPAGAVPARAYHIPAPDLSRGSSQPTNHHISYYGSANSRADEEDVVLTEQNSSNPSGSSSNSLVTGTGSSHLRRENNSEEVVSAVVLVKH